MPAGAGDFPFPRLPRRALADGYFGRGDAGGMRLRDEPVVEPASDFAQRLDAQGMVAGIAGAGGAVRILRDPAFAAHNAAVCLLKRTPACQAGVL